MKYLLPLAALLALLTLGAAAPTWTPTNLNYFKGAQAQIADLATFVEDGIAAFGKQDADALATAVTSVTAVATFFAEEQAPAQLAPVAVAGQYAGNTCAWVFDYFSKLEADAVTSPFIAPTLLTMTRNCLDAVQAARLELARSVAAVGAWPPTK